MLCPRCCPGHGLSRYRNQYEIGRDGTRAECVALYRVWLAAQLRDDPSFLDPLRDATGLACFCELDEECHADVLIEALAASSRAV